MKCGRVLGSEGSVKALKVGHACVSWGVDVEVVRSIECRRLPRFGSRTKSRRVPGRYLDESVSWMSNGTDSSFRTVTDPLRMVRRGPKRRAKKVFDIDRALSGYVIRPSLCSQSENGARVQTRENDGDGVP